MDVLHEDVWGIIWEFVGFGDRRGANVAVYQRINRQCRDFLSQRVRVEIDRNQRIPLTEFIQHYTQYQTMMEQKRNTALEWNDYRGYFTVVDFDEERWMYYHRLLQTYYFIFSTTTFPHFRGQLYFYEFQV